MLDLCQRFVQKFPLFEFVDCGDPELRFFSDSVPQKPVKKSSNHSPTTSQNVTVLSPGLNVLKIKEINRYSYYKIT